MPIKFEFLEHGDCTIITTDEYTMMIDGGNLDPFNPLIFYDEQPAIDTAIVSHIDRDHIGGVIDFLSCETNLSGLKHIVFNEPSNSLLFKKQSNSKNISISDGNSLKALLEGNTKVFRYTDVCTDDLTLNRAITGESIFRILSPSREQLEKLYKKWDPNKYWASTTKNISNELLDRRPIETMGNTDNCNDRSIPNGSSLAFLIEHGIRKFLILGDSHIDQVANQLKTLGYEDKDGKRLKLDFVKLSHHGSKNNTSLEFLSLIESDTFIVSKPSEKNVKKPDRDTIAKVVKHAKPKGSQKTIYINDSKVQSLNFTSKEMKEYSFEIQPTSKKGFVYL